VRRILIQHLLPAVLCVIPLLAAALVIAAAPSAALSFYLQRVSDSRVDWLILGLGTIIFVIQVMLSWRCLQWRGTGFNERPDRWLTHLAQAAEWFPLLGLIGTVTGILETFHELGSKPRVETREIIRLYAPAITATGSGLFMALINIFPSWVVLMGRDLIVSLSGGAPDEGGEGRP
jgi:MotA/TolQ/ExbB proton channel family